jgi:predicted nucleotidyltransferase
MKYLIKTLGGSTAYGLNTPESDLDHRGVFMNTDVDKILGLSRFDCIQKQETEDEVYYEVRKFFELLRDGNTGALEILFSDPINYLMLDASFAAVIDNRHQFVDTEKMFHCLLGYIQSERRLANGERTGQLGGKRKAQLDLYGFSPKNFVQLFRLCWAGTVLFETGEFPVHVASRDAEMHNLLFSIKTQPRNFTKDQLNLMVDEREVAFKQSFENRKVTRTFNLDLANEMLRRLYAPFVTVK